MPYTVNHGVALIIRDGSDSGNDKVEQLFEDLLFDVVTEKGLTAVQMFEAIKREAEKESDCFALVIIAHGSHESFPISASDTEAGKIWKHYVLGEDDKKLFVNDIVSYLKKSARLTGKPKLIFLQACRTKERMANIDAEVVASEKRDPGVELKSKDNVDSDTETNDNEDDHASEDDLEMAGHSTGADSMITQNEIYDVFDTECPDDFLIMYPVVQGKLAYRSDTKGAPMMKYLCEYRSMLVEGCGLMKYLTKVCQEIARYEVKTCLMKEEEEIRTILLSIIKHISKKENRQRLVDEVGESIEGRPIKDADAIIVEDLLKSHLRKMNADKMKKLITLFLPFKTSACIMHRLRSEITFPRLQGKAL